MNHRDAHTVWRVHPTLGASTPTLDAHPQRSPLKFTLDASTLDTSTLDASTLASLPLPGIYRYTRHPPWSYLQTLT